MSFYTNILCIGVTTYRRTCLIEWQVSSTSHLIMRAQEWSSALLVVGPPPRGLLPFAAFLLLSPGTSLHFFSFCHSRLEKYKLCLHIFSKGCIFLPLQRIGPEGHWKVQFLYNVYHVRCLFYTWEKKISTKGKCPEAHIQWEDWVEDPGLWNCIGIPLFPKTSDAGWDRVHEDILAAARSYDYTEGNYWKSCFPLS